MNKVIICILFMSVSISCKNREFNSGVSSQGSNDNESSLQEIETRVIKIENKVQEFNYDKLKTMARIKFLIEQLSDLKDDKNVIKLETTLDLMSLDGIEEDTDSLKYNGYLKPYFQRYLTLMNADYLTKSKSLDVENRKKRASIAVERYQTQFSAMLGKSLLDRVTRQFHLYPEINIGSDQLSLIEKTNRLEDFLKISNEGSLLKRLELIEIASAKKMAELEKTSGFEFWKKIIVSKIQEVELKVYPEL